MTAHVALSDAALEAMLVRRAARARPDDLHEKILAAVEEVPQARRPLLAWPRWFTAPVPGFGSMKAVVIVALLLALATGLALVAARWLDLLPRPPHHTAVLAPTGITTLTADTGSYARMVADRNGALWAWGESGRLVRFDPASGSGRSWTVDDDPAFVAANIAPARQRWGLADRTAHAAPVQRRGFRRRHRGAGGPHGGSGGRHRGARRQPVGRGRRRSRAALGRIVLEQARRRSAEPRRGRQLDRRRRGRTGLARLDAGPRPARFELALAPRRDGMDGVRRDGRGASRRSRPADRAALRRRDLGGHGRRARPVRRHAVDRCDGREARQPRHLVGRRGAGRRDLGRVV